MDFKIVKCDGYLNKINDGRFIRCTDTESCYVDLNSKSKPDNGFTWDKLHQAWIKDIPDGEGALEFLKTYYKLKEKRFTGVCVGYKDVELSAWLYIDYDSSSEKEYVGKQINETVKCAIVYYANNKKRYVPLENILESGVLA